MSCSTVEVEVRTVDEAREAIVDGGGPQFVDGTRIVPTDELLGRLQMVTELGGTWERTIHVAPNVLAYYISLGGQTRVLVQYPTFDNPCAYGDETDPFVGFAVSSFRVGVWPCLKCQVTDAGSLRIWPPEVSRDEWEEEGATSHMVCMAHGTVKGLSRPDDDDEDLWCPEYHEDHAPWCDGSCRGECSR